MATKQKRMGREDAPQRMAFFDATERVLTRDGYGKLNARHVAEEAGLTKQLLFYYFHSMDELVSETFSHYIAKFADRLNAALESEDIFRALWALYSNGNDRLFTEFMALANQNELLHQKIAKVSIENNALQVRALAGQLDRLGIDSAMFPPRVALFVLSALSRNLVLERGLGILECNDDLSDFIEWWLGRLSPKQEAAAEPASSPAG